MVVHGYDVSHYQNNMADTWFDDGTDFIICKASEGTFFTDSTFARWRAMAEKQEKSFGTYHYLRSNPSIEAEFFWNQVKNYNTQFVPIVDIEASDVSKDGAEIFCKRYYSLSKVYPWIYINVSLLNAGFASKWVKRHCGIWLAYYPYDKNPVSNWQTVNDLPIKAQKAINGCTLCAWQFTSCWKGYNLDADTAFMSKEQWRKYAVGDNTATNSQTTKQQTFTETATPQGNKWILARDVISGKYGNGDARKTALGTRYSEIQSCVNILLQESDMQLAKRVIRGEFGNGATRKTILGSRYNAVQSQVNKLV